MTAKRAVQTLFMNIEIKQLGGLLMRITRLIIILSILFLTIIPRFVNAQSIPEDARRHMARGLAAVEVAKSPVELEDAIKEFQEASRLAPTWPDPYYNLGLTQEKAGKLKEAVASLKQYLRLAPNVPDASKIQEQIYKLEYKAEQVITDEDALNIFASLADSNQWQLNGITNANVFSRDIGWVKSFSRSSKPGFQNHLFFEFNSGSCCPTLNGVCPGSALPIGKAVEFQTFYCACEDGGCLSTYNYRLDIMSRNRVKMFLRVDRTKKFGGGTSEASYEFIRR
ncbi:MAG: hypothetical protein C0399_02900 [Syntrophus sp. (in: bacteria)]|nr:hypothetical protein [Syntrophus sp. (in: bacteria)]